MKSNESSELLDLEHDIPTTQDDIVALRRARAQGRVNFQSYLAFLARLPAPPASVLRARIGPRGKERFQL